MRSFTLQNFVTLATDPVYGTIALRTLGIAALVTVTDATIAFPIAYYMARVAGGRTRALLLMAVLLPLWSSYLVRVYAWRAILSPGGLFDWAFGLVGLPNLSPGFSDVSMWIVFSYLWLPYMILPIFAGLERIPNSLISASEDLGAAPFTTFRRVILPLAFPAVVAGSIFTFSLTLGDYITPKYIGNSQFLGNVIYDSQGVAGNIPFAAAFAVVPVVIMAIYLLAARRLGAFDAL
ncbi:MAG TPA: ABC transporter permease [Candidatus Limnocylindrales bacterium]|nr:ABC transporter permease [Candidatus Limnocylindrales bacterium]